MGAIRVITAVAAAAMLSGCGFIPNLAGATSAAILAPAANMVTGATYGLQTLDHTVGVASASARATSLEVAQSRQTLAAYQPPPPVFTPAPADAPTQAYTYSPPKLTSAQRDAVAKAKDAPQPELKVIPAETLTKLTVDQRGLHDAAQRVALKDDPGEVLSWDDAGRSGSAVAEDEHKLGDMPCRTLVEKITIEDKTTEGRAVACRRDDHGHWTLEF